MCAALTEHPPDKWQQAILWDFPEGYRLYEHIKSKADGQTKVKNHSGGGHDRQDAYLYGYPKGPRKRFRSPIEFFPHLLWLCTDESSDYQNCSCRICSPVQLEADKPKPEVKPEVKAEVKPDVKPDATVKREHTPATTSQTATPAGTPAARPAAVQLPVRRPSSGPVASQSPGLKPATPSALRIQPPPSIQPTPLPQPRNLDQQFDSYYNKFVCRTGEVVWFYRPKTTAWGLGLIVRRWLNKDAPGDRAYLIQPLSHPYDRPAQEIVMSNQDLKPWLAWSAPSCTYLYLRQNTNLAYDQVDWNQLVSGRYGDGIPDVDASILAAKAIDATYTLFDCLNTTNNMGVEERHWNGIFLGAEKIWRGEPVRLRIGSGSDLMVVTDIIERTLPGAPQNQSNAQSPPPLSKVYFVGDLYTYATIPATNASAPPEPQPNANIPSRMREDMNWRNKLLVPMTRTFAYWKLIASTSRLEISEIKGRWYETSIVFVEPFKKAVQNNEGGNGIWMNSRGDATGLGKALGNPRPDRVAAFGTSVPKGLQLVDGIEAPESVAAAATAVTQGQPAEQHQPHPHQQQNVGYGMGSGNGDNAAFALDDFMNLDGIEEGGMAFPEDFGF